MLAIVRFRYLLDFAKIYFSIWLYLIVFFRKSFPQVSTIHTIKERVFDFDYCLYVENIVCWGYMMFRMWDVRDVECSGSGMFGMWDVGDVVCWGCGTFGMWDVRDVGYSEVGMFRMWDVRDVRCSGGGMFGM